MSACQTCGGSKRMALAHHPDGNLTGPCTDCGPSCSTCQDTGWVDTCEPESLLGAQACPDCDQRPVPIVTQPPYASKDEILKIEQGLANITGQTRHIRHVDGTVEAVHPNPESPYAPGSVIEVNVTHEQGD